MSLLDLIENFIRFVDSKGESSKLVAKNHQFHAGQALPPPHGGAKILCHLHKSHHPFGIITRPVPSASTAPAWLRGRKPVSAQPRPTMPI